MTERDGFGNTDIIGVDSMDLQCNLEFDEFNKVTNALNKLAEYEELEERCCKENSWGLKMLTEKWKEFIEDIQELYEYRKAEEQGKLLKLPCAEVYKSSGDYVFYIFEDEIVECINCGVQIEADGNVVFTLAANEKVFPYREPDSEHDLSPEDWCQETVTLSVDEWGKTVFLTREAAEATLKELENDRERIGKQNGMVAGTNVGRM